MLKRSFTYMVGQGLSAAISLVLLRVYTKYLSPDEFGIGSLIIITVAFGVTIFSFGINSTYMVKYYKLTDLERREAFSVVTIFFLAIVPISALLLPLSKYFQGYFVNDFKQIHFVILGLAILFGEYYQFFLTNLQIQQKAAEFVMGVVGYAVCAGSLNLYFILIVDAKGLSFLYSLLISNFVFTLFGMVFFRSHFIRVDPITVVANLKSLFRLGWPIVPSQISAAVLTSGDKYILNLMASPAEVGVYSVAYRFGSLVESLFVIPFFNAYNPIAYNLFVKDKNKFVTMQKEYLLLFVLILGMLIICVSYPFEYIFKGWIDERYWGGYGLIWIIAGAFFLEGIGFIFNPVLFMHEKLKYSMYTLILCSTLNIIMNLILMPTLGMSGGAMACLLTYLLFMNACLIINNKIFKIDYNMRRVVMILCVVLVCVLTQNWGKVSNMSIAFGMRGIVTSIFLLSLVWMNSSFLIISISKISRLRNHKLLCFLKIIETVKKTMLKRL